MKRIKNVMRLGLFFFLINGRALCQESLNGLKTTGIESYHLTVTFNKTTSLVFPYSIRSVDRGSRDVLAQKAFGVENVLFVKAAKENFIESNLSVITADGTLYSFLINYASNPSTLTISFYKDTTSAGRAPVLGTGYNEGELRFLTEKIARQKRTLYGVQDRKYEMLFRLNGIYIENGVVYFGLHLENRSNIDYDIQMVRFFTMDQKKARRTASQEIEIRPVYSHGNASKIRGRSENTLVYALPKFTIPDQKFLSIQLTEANGGRHLRLKVLNRSLIKAKRAPI